jgi:ABC-type sugar transport system substrate-binding protein
MKKRILSLLLATTMLFLLVVCKNERTGTSGTNATVIQGTKIPDDLGGYKIGFWYTPPTDDLSKGFRDVLDFCAEMTNCEMVYYDMSDWSAGAQSTAVESLVSLGCDAVIMVTGTSPALFQYLNDNKVYYTGMTRSYTREVALVTDNSDYSTGWLGDEGGVGGANYQSGYQLAEVLAKEGCNKIAYFDSSEGEAMGDERSMGVEAVARDYGMKIVASYRGYDWATGFSDILASFGSQLDGIVFPGGSGDMAIAAIQTAGYLGKIKLAQGNSAGEDTPAYLESGYLSVTSLGGSTFMAQMYMQLFNALSGADRLFEAGKGFYPMAGGFLITNVKEWNDANTIMQSIPGGVIPEDILKLNSLCTPDMTVKEREDFMKYYCTSDYWNVDSLYAKVQEYLKNSES